jgi:RAT1-interacting protein
MTEEDQRRKQNEHPSANQLHGIYAGRYFEVLSTINEQQQVNEEEEYCGIFTLHLGTKRLLIAAEIDCEDPKTKEYIELKTFRNLATSKDQFVFERFKLLAFWIQSYLVGTPKIICGFRNEKYQLTKLQTFKTTEIPSFCRKYWVNTFLLLLYYFVSSKSHVML